MHSAGSSSGGFASMNQYQNALVDMQKDLIAQLKKFCKILV